MNDRNGAAAKANVDTPPVGCAPSSLHDNGAKFCRSGGALAEALALLTLSAAAAAAAAAAGGAHAARSRG